jgi:hypothetical protein
MPPFIDTTWARITEESEHFRKRLDFVIEEKKESLIFPRSETGLASTARASLARFLDDMFGHTYTHDTPWQKAPVTFQTLMDPHL